MSTEVDNQFIRDYYERMSDPEIIGILQNNASGLTPVALEIVNAEIKRRNLDPNISKIVAAQQKTHSYTVESKAFDPEGCPVDEPTRIWLERYFLSLLDIFGRENTVRRKVMVPDKKDFPIRYDGSERAAFDTLQIIAAQMEVPFENVKLDFYDEELGDPAKGASSGVYWGKTDGGEFEISLLRGRLDEPEKMVATLSHEVAHIKLLGENRIKENDEPLTDLTTIFLGLGIFNANAAFETFTTNKSYGWTRQGYLSQMEWGYALALFAYVRKEINPAWANHLCQNVKGDFVLGQKFIANNEGEIFSQFNNSNNEILWAGDSNDICTAQWQGLILKTAWIEGSKWWWSVSVDNDEPWNEIDSSSNYYTSCNGSEKARLLAEDTARKFIRENANL